MLTTKRARPFGLAAALLATATAISTAQADPLGDHGPKGKDMPSLMGATIVMNHKDGEHHMHHEGEGSHGDMKKGMHGGHGGHGGGMHHGVPGGPVPVGVMADKVHPAGTIMLSYRYMRMSMNDNVLDGTSQTDADILALSGACGGNSTGNCRVIPQEMTGQMHMFGAMYAPIDDLDLMVMIPYIDREMEVNTYGMMSRAFLAQQTMSNQGFGDLRLNAAYQPWSSENARFVTRLGLSLPTGDYRDTTSMLMPNNTVGTMRMAYPMQLGSGTYDLLATATYAHEIGDFNLGLQYDALIRLESENSEGYSRGDEHTVRAWAGYDITDYLLGSLRFDSLWKGRIHGADPSITGMMQGADPRNHGGHEIHMNVGLDAKLPGYGIMKMSRLGIEVGVPLYQDLRGLQMEKQWSVRGGWRVMF